jgi:hypothetical protein
MDPREWMNENKKFSLTLLVLGSASCPIGDIITTIL